MNIAIITSAFGTIPPYGIGAVEKLWYDLGKEFVRQGHQVTFYAKKPQQKVKDLKQDGINVVFLNGYNRTRNRYTDMYGDILYSLKALWKMRKTDIVVLNTVTSPILCRFFKSKFKVSVYNVARFPRGQFKYYAHLDRLVPCSHMIEDAVRKQAPQVDGILKTINNPVNVDVFKPSASPKTEVPAIVFTGRIHPEKGLLNLVKAANQLNKETPVRLVLVGATDVSKGGGGDAYVAELKENADGLDLVFVNAISNPEKLAKIINDSAIYCYPPLPTTGDAMPCAPLEAMAAGIPVVLSNLPCFDDYAKDRINCLMFDVHENAVYNLYTTLKTLILDKKLREALGLNGVKTASEFSTEKIAKKFLQDFADLLAMKVDSGGGKS